MNYADFGLGTWHPKGGMYKIIDGMVTLATNLRGKIYKQIPLLKKYQLMSKAKQLALLSNDTFMPADIVLSGADYHHTETLLPSNYRQYSEKYWDKKVFAPSSLLFYVGLDKKLEKRKSSIRCFLIQIFDAHAKTIYDTTKLARKTIVLC